MAVGDNTTLNAGTGGDAMRDIDRASNGIKTQVVQLDFGGAAPNAEQLVSGSNPLPVQAKAGEAHLGAVGGNSIVASDSFARPADTTAYAVGDLVANNVTAASVVALQPTVARVAGGTGVIRRIRLSTSHTGLAGTETFRVHLFRTAPTPVNGDNGPFSVNGIGAVALGRFDVTLDHVYSDGSIGFAATDVIFAAAAQKIFALIEARVAYTPVSAETFTLSAEVLQD